MQTKSIMARIIAPFVNRKPALQSLPKERHGIAREAIPPRVLGVIRRLREGGFEAFVVGGGVRDLLLQRAPKDFDVATNAHPEQIRALFRNCRLIGRRFRLAHVFFGREYIEVTTYRASPQDLDEADEDRMRVAEHGQLLRDNVYGSRLDDVLRRDFTVNALYFDPDAETVLDYVGGVADLRARTLRTIGAAAERFREDPVRMLRAARFAAKLGFTVDAEALAAMPGRAELLLHVSPHRMLDETIKLFHGGAAQASLHTLRALDLFRFLFPQTDTVLKEQGAGAEICARLIERALANTDARVREGKAVIPPFLIACFLWEPIRRAAAALSAAGTAPAEGFERACHGVIHEQNRHVAVTKHVAGVVRDILWLQHRLEERRPRAVRATLQHERFRAAYDFLLMRAQAGEPLDEIAEWWTRIQALPLEDQNAMIHERHAAAPAPARRKRRRRRGRRDRRETVPAEPASSP
jgi:poly(A) polymerase